jgi:hypothetical protein
MTSIHGTSFLIVSVACHAAATLGSFCQDVALESLTPFLAQLVETLFLVAEDGKTTFVQEQALVSLSFITDRAGIEFKPYYASVMPLLIKIMDEARDADFIGLREKAAECASFVGIPIL